MRAGLLRHRIQIQSPTIVNNESGGFNEVWILEALVWGKVSPITGKEFYNQKQVDADVTHIVTMRFNTTAINPKWRLVREDQILYISSVLNIDENDNEFTIACTERVGIIKETPVYQDNKLVKQNNQTVFQNV